MDEREEKLREEREREELEEKERQLIEQREKEEVLENEYQERIAREEQNMASIRRIQEEVGSLNDSLNACIKDAVASIRNIDVNRYSKKAITNNFQAYPTDTHITNTTMDNITTNQSNIQQ